jgi:transposase
MAKTLTLELSAEQRRELEKIRDRYKVPHMREKAAAILKISNGLSGRQVALKHLLKPRRPETVYEWVRRYRAEGVKGLSVRSGRGRKPASPP